MAMELGGTWKKLTLPIDRSVSKKKQLRMEVAEKIAKSEIMNGYGKRVRNISSNY